MVFTSLNDIIKYCIGIIFPYSVYRHISAFCTVCCNMLGLCLLLVVFFLYFKLGHIRSADKILEVKNFGPSNKMRYISAL